MATSNLSDPAVRAAALEHQKHVYRIRNEAKRAVAAEERGSTAPPPIFTLSELLAQPDRSTPWRVADWQPRNTRVILAAQFKAGKTTLVANVIRSLCDGDPFLSRHGVTPVEGTIALLDFEMGTDQLKHWYRDQQIAHTDRILVVPMRGLASSFNILDQQVRAEWAVRLRGVEYLVVDCLRPILDGLGLDEHHDVGVFLVALDALLAEAGIAEALVVHHMGHTNERSRGDSRLRDWPDVEWRLVRKDDDPASARFIAAYGRDVDIAEQELGYDSVTRRLTIVGGSRRDAKVEDALSAVLAFIGAAVAPPGRNAILKGLKESGHAKNVLIAAIKLGIARGHVVTTPGKQGAQLHSIITDASSAPEYVEVEM